MSDAKSYFFFLHEHSIMQYNQSINTLNNQSIHSIQSQRGSPECSAADFTNGANQMAANQPLQLHSSAPLAAE